MPNHVWIAGIALACLSACGSNEAPEPKEPEAAPPESVIGAPLQRSLDKAHSVEALNAERKGGIDAAVDAESGN